MLDLELTPDGKLFCGGENYEHLRSCRHQMSDYGIRPEEIETLAKKASGDLPAV
ncbi:hypothetical protein DSOL_5012 [Desulfosporosinus metallidurans]|uniref:Uncharacterized protein n=1 Tax=Desulfosporosinus metallidurans TaxID=1888891 RepID=A0A1Q8QGE8_9FIRM|nr:hypothetical protein DSOL_5012 [Desulfosporosinus metallidurans]